MIFFFFRKKKKVSPVKKNVDLVGLHVSLWLRDEADSVFFFFFLKKTKIWDQIVGNKLIVYIV